MCEIDLDPCPVWNEVPRKARTTKHCRGCGSPINPGDAYLDHSSLFEGSWSREACCFVCWWIRADFGCCHRVTVNPSGLFETVRECADEDGTRRWRLYTGLMFRRIRAAKRARQETA